MRLKLERADIYYEIRGSGQPVVMIHGFVPDHRLMEGCMEPIFKNRPGYKRIYFDLPGMGSSPSSDFISSSDDMLDVVVDFIEKTVPDEHFLVVGESYGGYLARGVIKAFPDRVDGALFICPVIIADPRKRDRPRKQVLLRDAEFLETLSFEDRKEFTSMHVQQVPRTWFRFKEEFLGGMRLADAGFLSRIWHRGYPFSFDVDKAIGVFPKPALFLLGRQDSVVGYADALRLVENYPRATFAVLDMAGHALQIEQEALFNVLVNEWLDRAEILTESRSNP